MILGSFSEQCPRRQLNSPFFSAVQLLHALHCCHLPTISELFSLGCV